MTRHCLQLALASTILLAIGCSGPQADDTGPTEARLASTPDVVAYCHESFLERIDLGGAGQSHGDIVTWSADVFDEIPESRKKSDGRTTGIASGYMVVTRPNDEMEDHAVADRELRLSTMTMAWDGTDDSLIFTGLHAYGHDAPRLDNTVTRPIVGGTGRFLGRPGIAIVTPEGEAWFRVEIYLTR